jgi:DNA-directed RNA polymerase specialized sigma24 family protein
MEVRQAAGIEEQAELRLGRFRAYFPRVFAFACSASGSEDSARDVTVAAFANALSLPEAGEDGFEITLFRAAREICNRGYRVRLNDGLSTREREVISLVFDGQLEMERVADVLGIRQDAVAATLATGLRRLNLQSGGSNSIPAAIAGYS